MRQCTSTTFRPSKRRSCWDRASALSRDAFLRRKWLKDASQRCRSPNRGSTDRSGSSTGDGENSIAPRSRFWTCCSNLQPTISPRTSCSVPFHPSPDAPRHFLDIVEFLESRHTEHVAIVVLKIRTQV